MSFLLPCPNCGPRPVDEFTCTGEVTVRPKSVADAARPDGLPLLQAQRCGRPARVVVPPQRLRGLVHGGARHPHERSALDRGAFVQVRLEPQQGERIDRSREVTFSFHGATVHGFEGDTLASALFAEGQRIFSRSFKYHRPRGLLCCRGSCPNCMVQVDGTPNVRSCVTPIREGARVEAQNVWGSLDHDLLAITDKIGGPFTPVGFYYRTMIRPRRAWPLYEKFLRNVAGLGKVDKHAGRAHRYDVEHRHAEVLVVGGGDSGLAAAREAAAEGKQTVLVDNGPDPIEIEGVETVQGTALGVFEGGLVPVDGGLVLYRYRAGNVVVAAGARRAAAPLPRQRPRRCRPPRDRAPARRPLVAEARLSRGRDHGRRRWPGHDSLPREGRHGGRGGRRPARDPGTADRRQGPRWTARLRRGRRAQGRL